MKYSDIIKYTASLTDDELIQCAETAHTDLHAAEPQTEWQESCFAGLMVYCDEMGRRGLKRDSLADAKRDGSPPNKSNL